MNPPQQTHQLLHFPRCEAGLQPSLVFGDGGQGGRWVAVAPPDSPTALALNPPMGGQPGGGGIGVETPDLEAEHQRLSALDGVEVGDPMGGGEGPVPRMFSVNDPDGNWIWVIQAAG